MTDKESPSEVDFSQFFVRFRTSIGRVSGAAFDREAFSSFFGVEAADAYAKFSHFSSNTPDTAESIIILERAQETLRNVVGVDPKEISKAKLNARIEDI